MPFGFDLAADGVQLVPNADEQRVLGLIGELRAAGISLRAIAEEIRTVGEYRRRKDDLDPHQPRGL